MKTVSDTLHLQRRGGTWHYYRRTPSNLVSVIGRRFFKRSLKTSSLVEEEAQNVRRHLKLDTLIDTLASMSALPINVLPKSTHKARQSERYELWRDADIERDVLMRGEDPNGDSWTASTKRRVLAEAGAISFR
jgi:hypothetical protein